MFATLTLATLAPKHTGEEAHATLRDSNAGTDAKAHTQVVKHVRCLFDSEGWMSV